MFAHFFIECRSKIHSFQCLIPVQRLGPSALAGIATVILIFPLNGFIAKMRSKLQVSSMLFNGVK